MSLVRWDPFRNINSLQDRINRLFDESFPRSAGDEGITLGAWTPAVDIYETENSTVIQAELAGVKREDVSIELKDNVITLKGERSANKNVREENYYRRERSYGKFHRAFSLPVAVNPDQVKATFKEGVLVVEIPKSEEKKPKQITIK